MNNSNHLEKEIGFQSVLKIFTEAILIVILITILIASSVMLKSTLFGISFFLVMVSIGIYIMIMKVQGIIPLYSCLLAFLFWTAHSYMMRHDDPVITTVDANHHFHDLQQQSFNRTISKPFDIVSEAYGVSGTFSFIYSLILFAPLTICSTLEQPKSFLKYRAFSILIILISVSVEPNTDANLATSPLSIVIFRSTFAVVLFIFNAYSIRFLTKPATESTQMKTVNKTGIGCMLNILHCLMSQFTSSCIIFSVQTLIYIGKLALVDNGTESNNKFSLWFRSFWNSVSSYNHLLDNNQEDESSSGSEGEVEQSNNMDDLEQQNNSSDGN